MSPLSFCRVGTRGGLSALRLNIPEAMQCAARDPAMPLVPFVACPCMLYVYHLCLGSRSALSSRRVRVRVAVGW